MRRTRNLRLDGCRVNVSDVGLGDSSSGHQGDGDNRVEEHVCD